LLGQYAIDTRNGNWFADFDGLSIMNLSNPSAFDIVATDGNHAQTLFSFEQFGNMFVYADRFILTSKDLIINQGNEQDAYNYNRGRFYIKQATITIKGSITGDRNGLKMFVSAANTINNNNPNWVKTRDINLNTELIGGQLIVHFDFYPNSNNVLYRINNDPWQSTNIPRNRGSSLVYRIEIRPSNWNMATDLMGNNIRGLTDNINITGIQVSYISSPRTIRITNWKEVR
jgi:type II secretory pathway pseudopilin PulG